MKAKKLLCNLPLLLATTFVSQAALAAVVDIEAIRLSKIDSPLDYKDARATQLAVNSLVNGTREAAAEYFFKNVKGNYDKFELYATTSIPSRRLMYLDLNLKMKPGFTLKNGKAELTKRFRINLFNHGECVTLDNNTRLWNLVPDFTSSSTCNAENNPALNRHYTWVYQPLENSTRGACEERNSGTGTWSVTTQTKGLDKLSCEKKMATAPNSFRWYSSFPEISADFDLRGYSVDIKEQMPQLPSTIKDIMRSINIPKGYRIEHYPQENFQGTPGILGAGIYSNQAFIGETKSIKVIESPLNPEVKPPTLPDTVLYRMRNRGAYEARVIVSYRGPDGKLYKDGYNVLNNRGYFLNVPYGSTDMRFQMLRYTGLAWDPIREIYEKRVSPVKSEFCAVVKGTTLSPSWSQEPCK